MIIPMIFYNHLKINIHRYCRDVKGAAPLWPVSAGKPSKQDIPKCCHCSNPMFYEFQVRKLELVFLFM